MTDIKKRVYESFTEETFTISSSLLNQGYVIDSKEEQNISFTSFQIEHISQGIFEKLCKKYKVRCEISISVIGGYYKDEGAFYIVFNEEFYDYLEAKSILDRYIKTL